MYGGASLCVECQDAFKVAYTSILRIENCFFGAGLKKNELPGASAA